MAWFYKEENNSLICTVKPNQELYFFVPECYFGSRSAIIDGEYVSLLGVFNYAIYQDDKPVSELKTFKFPSIFLTQPHAIQKMKDVVLTKNMGKQDYRVLKYKPGDKLVVEMNIPQQVENIEEFVRLWVITGHIPTIDYRQIWEYFINNIKDNGNKYGLNNQVFGVFQAKLCRNPENYEEPFRISKAKKNGEWENYKPVSVKEVVDYASPYISMSSENFDDSVVAATMMTSNKYSPLEKVLTGK